MAAPMRHALKNTVEDIKSFLDTPEDFLSKKTTKADKFAIAAKGLYDTSHTAQDFTTNNSLPQLTVKGFDDEQIWQQLELENDVAISILLSHSARLLSSKTTCAFISARNKDESSGHQSASKNKLVHNNVKGKESLNRVGDQAAGGDLDNAGNDSDFDDDVDDFIKQTSDVDNDDEPFDKNDKFFDFTGDSDEDLEYGSLGQTGDLDKELFDKEESDESGEDSKNKTDTKNSSKTVTFKFEDGSDKQSTNRKGKSDQVSMLNIKKKKSVVDDAFFKLSDLEQFLDKEDRREEKRQRKEEKARSGRGGAEDDDSEEDGEEIDLFAEIDSEEEDLHYADFFDQPDGEVERQINSEDDDSDRDAEHGDLGREDGEKTGSDEEDEEDAAADVGDNGEESNTDVLATRHALQRNLLLDSDSDGEDALDILGGKKKQDLSSFEQRQEKLKKKMSELEERMLSEKPWQMTGEVTGGKRPENSLLQENLQFDYTTRLTPEITEETTKSLEDLIRQRIRDKAWDDVERKVKPKENPFEFKKRVTLDQEKSKLSLGQIYEQEYLKQQQTEEVEKKDPDHEEIKKMMTSLFIKLDALSNFHYTPKQAAPEVQIITNQPSIAMEEVAPVAVSDAKLLAPEEVKDKVQGEMKGASERTKTDRERERQRKKKEKRMKRREREQRERLIEKLNPGLGNKYSRDKALKDLEKDSKTQNSRVTLLKDDRKQKTGLTSSKSFFSQLQDEVKAGVRSKQAEKRKQTTLTKNANVKKFKL
ncbi:U3 small nucleolar ribonucleoprotein protein MPP10-like [Mya arenaria]|uniref:U3 small nucleolar ribonucleoprotein protein MPP10-like n=1 Tax=Mya arenaria TaxID=6604 RepID=UPI0022E26D27|nr:U3 small nucleolar ribonucleoprotein protein MPP10-like [Mya arenaria]